MVKVNFIIIGAAKSATTSLCDALSFHPDVCICHPKEPQFFSKTDWRLHLDTYHQLFTKTAKLYGEGSTNYSKFPSFNKHIHSDIYEYNPEMKIIYIIRNPIDRIKSQYIHMYKRGHETIKDINEAIRLNSGYINYSKYAMQIEPYIAQFGPSNVKILIFDDYIKNPQNVFNIVCDFLKIKQIAIDSDRLNKNTSHSYRIMHHKYDNPKSIFEKLRKVILVIKSYLFKKEFSKITEDNKQFISQSVKEDIYKMEQLTQRDLSHWLKY
uniref:sulfotransferase family protein n=1 Tax=Gelidibacter sp. TaxID=2018083 RepID=UPI00404B8713